MDIVKPELEHYCHQVTQTESPLLQELLADTLENMSGPEMLSGRVVARLLQLLIRLMGARRVLEIGTYTGYSTLAMAEALPADGKIISCDVNIICERFAGGYFKRSEHGSKIDLRIAPALQSLEKIADNHFDLIFLDADKANYLKYYQKALSKLRAGGLFVIDNALWRGQVLQPESKHAKGVHELNAYIADDTRVDNVLLSVRDGVHLVRKK